MSQLRRKHTAEAIALDVRCANILGHLMQTGEASCYCAASAAFMTLSYGRLCNKALMLRYGFTVAGNPHASLQLHAPQKGSITAKRFNALLQSNNQEDSRHASETPCLTLLAYAT